MFLTLRIAPESSETRAQRQSPAITPVFSANRNRELTGKGIRELTEAYQGKNKELFLDAKRPLI
jgi:hypothetical protein